MSVYKCVSVCGFTQACECRASDEGQKALDTRKNICKVPEEKSLHVFVIIDC